MLTRAAELVEAAVEETLAYYSFPEEHWRRLRHRAGIDGLTSFSAPIALAG
jgi:hypothetical protein